MKQFRYKEWLFVEVPEDAKNFVIESGFDYLDYERQINGLGIALRTATHKSEVPIKNIRQYSIIGKADELTDWQWEQIVEIYFDEHYAHPYFVKYDTRSKAVITPCLSGYSLLKSKSMKPSTTLVLKLNEAHTGDKV